MRGYPFRDWERGAAECFVGFHKLQIVRVRVRVMVRVMVRVCVGALRDFRFSGLGFWLGVWSWLEPRLGFD